MPSSHLPCEEGERASHCALQGQVLTLVVCLHSEKRSSSECKQTTRVRFRTIGEPYRATHGAGTCLWWSWGARRESRPGVDTCNWPYAPYRTRPTPLA